MKLSQFLKSKRTWIIIGGSVVETIAALFPDWFVGPSEVLRALLNSIK